MKVYVDELPKTCFECPCFANDIECNCKLDDGTNEYCKFDLEEDNCPLKTINELEKQIRLDENHKVHKFYRDAGIKL